MIAPIVLLAASAALVSAQGPPPAATTPAGCTSKSFVIPSWVVSDFSSVGGKTSFTTFNRASNVSSTVECTGGSCTSSGKLEAFVELTESAAVVSLNETWNCNDRPGGERFMFWAIGNNSVPLTAADGKYTARNPQVLVKGSLIAPVEITPIYFEGPTGHDAPGCSAKSKAPKWTIASVAYSDATGDGIESVAQRSLSLVLINQGTGYDASCMAFGDPDSPSDILTLNCAGLEFQSPTIGRYSTSTQATYNVVTRLLAVTQSWYCDDEDPGRPQSISATGSAPLTLTCTTRPLPGNNTQTNCELPADYTLSGSVTATSTLAPFSIEDPTPGTDGCTISSIFSPKWSFSNFIIEGKATGAGTVAVPTKDAIVGFDIILETQNRRYQYPMPITQGKTTEGGWSECEIGSDGGNGLPLWPYECKFKYDAAKKELVLDANWECRDLDVRHPILFAGVATTTVDAEIMCEKIQEFAVCGTEDPSYTWSAPISSVTWTAGEPVTDEGGLSGGLQGR